MAENSNIEWCDHTFNPWIGCTKVSPGCAHCYAESQDNFRSWTPEGWGKGKPRKRTSVANWKKPLQWNRDRELLLSQVVKDEAFKRNQLKNTGPGESPWTRERGEAMSARKKEAENRPRVFCASLADWLDDEVPIEWLADLLDVICRTPHLDWLLLTKRPELFRVRMEETSMYLGEQCWPDDQPSELYQWQGDWIDGTPPPNVWIGTSVEDGPRKTRIEHLRQIPAKVRFLSCEPLLADISYINLSNGIHWVIVGGESGPNARPFDSDWARELREQCRETGTAFFMKQMGGKRKPFPPIPDDLLLREFPEVKGDEE